MQRKWRQYLTFVLAVFVTVLAGWWSMRLARDAEFVHFSVNFPTQPGLPQQTRAQLGGPWGRLPEQDWSHFPAGGVLVWGREGAIFVDLNKQGLIKKILQKWDVTLSTHWARNVGLQAYRIRLELDMCGFELEWDTFERDWQQASQSALRRIEPGRVFNMDWHFSIPPERRRQRNICQGELRILDADSRQLLTRLPILIRNSEFET